MENNVKENWKETGKELGKSFKKFGKACVKSVRTVADKVDDKCNNDENVVEAKEVENNEEKIEVSVNNEKESNVFNDGTWRETGKGLGKAFSSLGKSIGNTFTGKRNK